MMYKYEPYPWERSRKGDRLPKIETPQCTNVSEALGLRCLRRLGHEGDHGSHWYTGNVRTDRTWST